MRTAILAALVAHLLFPASSMARTWYITPDGTGDAPTIREGLAQSAAGDSIVIGCGTYTEGRLVLRADRTLMSTSGDPSCVTLDGQGLERVLHCQNYSSPQPPVILVGLTIANGSPDVVPTNAGAGLYSGGLAVEAYDCVFSDCAAGGGGAVFLAQAQGVFERCVFAHNGAVNGAALLLQNSPTIFRSSVFVGNSAVNTGGAIYEGYAYPVIDQCSFIENSAGLEGSAIYTASAPGTTTITRSIIVGGTGAEPVTCYGDVALDITCTDIFDNEAGDWVGCLSSHAGLNGNFSEDPLFCAPQDAQFTIRSNSPCAPENSSGCGLIGALPVACGPVNIDDLSWGALKSQYRIEEIKQ